MNNLHKQSTIRRARRGSAVLETILVLPLLVTGVFSIVEFSLLVNRQQHLVEACRNGALVATRLAPETIAAAEKGVVPEAVRNAIEGRLSEANIREVEIKFTIDKTAHAEVAAAHVANGCRAEVAPLDRCVRVAITVPATELSPNLLGGFGFDITERDYSAAVVYPYER